VQTGPGSRDRIPEYGDAIPLDPQQAVPPVFFAREFVCALFVSFSFVLLQIS
jgi:hypothetical protein